MTESCGENPNVANCGVLYYRLWSRTATPKRREAYWKRRRDKQFYPNLVNAETHQLHRLVLALLRILGVECIDYGKQILPE